MSVTTQKNSDSIKLIDRRWPYSKDMPQSQPFSADPSAATAPAAAALVSLPIFLPVSCSASFYFRFRVLRYLGTCVVVFVTSFTWSRALIPWSCRDVECFV